MSEWTVQGQLCLQVYATVTVEADTEEEAEEIASQMGLSDFSYDDTVMDVDYFQPETTVRK